MAYQVLARKWRPQRFQDVVGQKHITKSLQNAFKRGKVGHAYMLTGTRGIGKTTVARLFAKSLRCENRQDDANSCGECQGCLDFDSGSSMNVMEIDGASNNSVEDVRDLINNVQYLPTSGQYKIYIIDEVHMLSSSAFNALLKTLEEPPEHVVFIMATTEPQKLLGTVLSRCQRFDFRNANLGDLVTHVESIAEKEGISFKNPNLIQQICRQGRGSFRDTLSLVDQVLSFADDKKIDEETVALALGLARSSSIREMVEGILSADQAQVSQTYRALLNENISVKNIALSLLDHLFEVIENIDHPEYLKKNDLLLQNTLLEDISSPELIWVFENFSKESAWALETLVPEKTIEILLQKLAKRREYLSGEKPKKKSELTPEPSPEPEIEPETEDEASPLGDPASIEEKAFSPSKRWEDFLAFLRQESPALVTYIEHGNLLREEVVDKESGDVRAHLGFKPKDEVMYDYVSEKETRQKLTQYLAEFFQCEEQKIDLSLEKIQDGESFKSMIEIREEEEGQEQEKKKQEFLKHPMVEEAQRVFDSKIDKLILNGSNDE